MLIHSEVRAQDSSWINVHFIYGSKPSSSCDNERNWFGGIHGGHVGIEFDTGKVLDFGPRGKFHLFGQKENRHSAYSIHSMDVFWRTFKGCDSSDLKTMSIRIRIGADQRIILDSLVHAYLSSTPYDYAFFGMRCAAACYDVLDKIGVLPEKNHLATWFHIFYPKRLRIRMIQSADKDGWGIRKQKGSNCRIWEKD